MGKSYDFVVSGIIPATQQAFKDGGINGVIRLKEGKSLIDFKSRVKNSLTLSKPPRSFPTSKQVFVAVIQFYTSMKKDYNLRDVDNMAKTVLDILEQNRFYKNDSQVRTLLVSKKVDLKIAPQNFGYIYIETMKDYEDKKEIYSLIPKALALYGDLKDRKAKVS